MSQQDIRCANCGKPLYDWCEYHPQEACQAYTEWLTRQAITDTETDTAPPTSNDA